MNLRDIFLSLLLLAASTGLASADTKTVTVLGGAAMAFSPPSVTINKGDSITFTYGGGFLPHNVRADNNSFRCAVGCDGAGGNGNVTSAAWSSTVTFNQAGTFGYYCEEHGNLNGGMRGSITVNDTAPPSPAQNIVNGLSGNWDDPTPNQGGHGFQFEILPNNGMLAIWFVFNPAGTQQAWIYSQGGYDPNSNDVVLPALLETGGAFPPNFDRTKLTVTPWGILEFKFTDCGHGTAEYTPNEAAVNAGYQHIPAFPIQQLTKLAGTTCP